jgi:hypothetical protein
MVVCQLNHRASSAGGFFVGAGGVGGPGAR